MLRFYNIESMGPHSVWRDRTWTVMADSSENAAKQLKKRLDNIYYSHHVQDSERTSVQIRVHEMTLDDFGVFVNTNPQKWDVFDI